MCFYYVSAQICFRLFHLNFRQKNSQSSQQMARADSQSGRDKEIERVQSIMPIKQSVSETESLIKYYNKISNIFLFFLAENHSHLFVP